MNRRKAMIGYLVYTAAKPFVRRAVRSRARGAVPGRREGSKAPNNAAIAVALAAVLGGLMFWRSRRAGGEETPDT